MPADLKAPAVKAGPSQGTVLVVDDTEANRYVLARLLAREGYHVLEAASGAAAQALLDERPDVIVLDVNLPDIKGTELARRLKADPGTASIMLLNMSASFTRTQDRIEALDRGADGYLTQPIDPREFLATVKSLIRIRRAEEAVRKSNRDLANFAYTASHDLQEPLRVVSSYLGILQDRAAAKLDAREQRYLAQACEAATRMGRMVRDLLTLAAADHGAFRKEPVDAAAVVANALANLDLKIAEAQAVVTVGPLPQIMADQVLLAQVFQNLIANGIKFRSERPPRVHISAELVEGHYRFRIEDNGIGIPPESLEKIFAIFERLHGRDSFPGSGIGLALCKRIIERHGGDIGALSEPGCGSTFWFTLPA